MIKQTKFTFFPVEETFRKQKSMSKLYRVLESSKKPKQLKKSLKIRLNPEILNKLEKH